MTLEAKRNKEGDMIDTHKHKHKHRHAHTVRKEREMGAILGEVPLRTHA